MNRASPILLCVLLVPADGLASVWPERVLPQSALMRVYDAGDRIATASPDVALLPSGRFGTVWADQRSSRFQAWLSVYNADGSLRRKDVRIHRDLTSNHDVLDGPRTAASSAGTFVSTWTDMASPRTNQQHPDVYFAIHNSDGNRTVSDRRVFEPFPERFSVILPRVAAGESGTFCIAWSDNRAVSGGTRYFDIYGRRYRNNGDKVDNGEFYVNPLFAGVSARTPAVAPGDAGAFLFVWEDDSVQLSDNTRRSDIYCRLVPASYVRAGGELDPAPPAYAEPDRPVSYEFDHDGHPPPGQDHARWPAVAFGDSRYVIAWQNDNLEDGTTDIRASVRTANGAAYSSPLAEFRVDAGPRGTWQRQPAVAYLGEGRFLLAWADQDPELGSNLLGRVLDAGAGAFLTGEVFLNVYDDDFNTGPGLELALTGRQGAPALAIWTLNITGLRGILARAFRPRPFADVNGDGRSDGRDVLVFSRAWKRRVTAADLSGMGLYGNPVGPLDALLLQEALRGNIAAQSYPVKPIVQVNSAFSRLLRAQRAGIRHQDAPALRCLPPAGTVATP